MNARPVTFCIILAAAICARPAKAAVVTFDDVERGNFSNSGSNFDGDDYVAIGESEFWGVQEYRGFLTFDLGSVSGIVTGASLSLQATNYNATSSMNVNLFDYVLGNDDQLGSSLTSVAAFEDLGSGTLYANTTVDTPLGDTFAVTLSDDAVADINSRGGGLFTIGFAAESLVGTGNQTVRLDDDPSTSINQLNLEITAVPEPSSLLFITATGLLVVGGVMWRRRPTFAAYPSTEESEAALN